MTAEYSETRPAFLKQVSCTCCYSSYQEVTQRTPITLCVYVCVRGRNLVVGVWSLLLILPLVQEVGHMAQAATTPHKTLADRTKTSSKLT